MRLLLDTHTLLWVMNDNSRLSRNARTTVETLSNDVFVSVVSIWEAATKYRQGKLPEAAPLISDPSEVLARMKFSPLALQLQHARLGGSIDHPHKDPFDRMLAAQALLEGLVLVSADAIFDSMMVTRLW